MTGPLNPMVLEQKLLEADRQLHEAVDEVSKAYDAFISAEREWKNRFAIEFLAAKGTVEDRKQQAYVATEALALERDKAEVVYKRISDYHKAVATTISALQTLAKPVTAAYQSPGGQYG